MVVLDIVDLKSEDASFFKPIEALNDKQKEAVLTTEGPLLMLAGAGTGKTRALTTRLAYILHMKKSIPQRILSVTFTNKAAREMKDRIQSLLGFEAEGFWIGTFHSLCVRILRRHAEKIFYNSDFTILDTDDQLRLIKQIIKAENLDEKELKPRLVAGYISRWKDQVKLPQDVKESIKNYQKKEKTIANIYEIYQERLKSLNAMDFGDLLLLTLTLFRQNLEVLSEYQNRFDYILVDEYQDTNTAQYLWLRLLAQKNKNICCVGDDDQSIYGWRGAEVKNILQFEKDFPGSKIIRLEQNYRSTPYILDAASSIISNNASRLGKKLWTDEKEGEVVTINTLWSGDEEASWVANEIEACKGNKVLYSQMAVLVRAGYQTREFEERFLVMGIPYRVIGGLRFYERAEIRDAIAYLRIVASSLDSLALERIINVPKRGIGPSAVNTLYDIARGRNISLLEAAHIACREMFIKGKTRLSLMDLLNQIDRWQSLLPEKPHPELAQIILEESGYISMWRADKTEQAQGRLENLKELVTALREYPSLSAFLEHVSLVVDSLSSSNEDVVTLMTLHSSKGLEFDRVFLTGWEEGIFPSQRTLLESGQLGLEEERRLAYVGITRAKTKAYITSAKNRKVYGKWQSSVPSRFIAELPSECVEDLSDITGSSGGSAYDYVKDISTDKVSYYYDKKPKNKIASSSKFKCGDKVIHSTYGEGTVLLVDNNRLDIFFSTFGRKKIMEDFVEKI